MIDVREPSGTAELDAAMELRRVVFGGEQGVTDEEEFDGRDDEATHLVAVDDGDVIATCRLLVSRDGETVQFGRLVVAAARRRQGVASMLLQRAEVWAREHDAARISLAAQTDAIPLYVTQGYVERGARFMEARIEHVWMDKTLA